MYITQRKKEKIWKIIHITSYVFNGLFLLLLLIGLCGCSSSNNNDDLHKQRTTNTIQRKLDLKDSEEWNGIENYITRDSNYFYVYPSFVATEDFYNLINTYYSLDTISSYGVKTGSYGVCYGANYTNNINGIVVNRNNTNLVILYFQNGTTSTRTYPSLNYWYSLTYKNASLIRYDSSSSNQVAFYYLRLNQYSSAMTTAFNDYIDSLEPSSGGGSSGDDVTNVEQSNIINLGTNYNPLNVLNLPLYQSGYLVRLSTPLTAQNVLELTGLTFESNGQVFDKIIFDFPSLNAFNFSFDNGQTLLNTTDYSIYQGYCFFLLMRYVNTTENISVNVMQTPLDFKGNDNYFNIATRIITNNEYMTINIISDDETIMRDNMTTKQLLLIQGSVDNSVIGGYSPFTLFSSAFTSISSILNIAILPGITIGLLFFMPLLVVIITLIFKLVKK